jgi:hypothetical protein
VELAVQLAVHLAAQLPVQLAHRNTQLVLRGVPVASDIDVSALASEL